MNRSSTCNPHTVHAFLRNDLNELEVTRFEEHLAACSDWRVALDQNTAEPAFWDDTHRFLKDDDGELEPLSTLGESDEPIDHHSINRILESLAPTDDPSMLGRLDGYEISGVVGHGGMGAVLKGHNVALNRVVAIKVMAPHLACSGAARRRFAREAQATAAITHENVIDIYGVPL